MNQSQMIAVDKLVPYERNPKKHPESQINSLAEMFQTFGFDQPIVVDANMVIIKGHGRRLAAIKAGMAMVPVIVRTDLSAAKARAARIADNKIAETDWDTEALMAEVRGLRDEDEELIHMLGIADAEMAELLNADSAPLPPAIDPGKPEFLVVIECESEDAQSRLFDEFKGRGIACKII